MKQEEWAIEHLWKLSQPMEIDSYAGAIPPDKKTFTAMAKALFKENMCAKCRKKWKLKEL